jgi:hypothetical protein
VNRAIYTATAQQGAIGCINDGVHMQLSNVAGEYFYFLVHGGI